MPGWPGLRWVDMLAGDVLELDPDTQEVRRHRVGTVAAVLRPRVDGGVVIAVEHGFALTDAKLQDVRPLGELWTDPGVRMNEGDCDPDGRFYCGSMAYDKRPGAGSVYRLDPDGTVTTVLTGVTISNGLTWSGDNATAYYIDTPTHGVDAFDYSPDRGLSNRRTLFHIPESDGAPDGMTIDTEGRLWIALWGGAAVRCYQPDGTLVEHIPPSGHPGHRLHLRRPHPHRPLHHHFPPGHRSRHPTPGRRHLPHPPWRPRPPNPLLRHPDYSRTAQGPNA
jgi:sugar lactone lactonase YvrE